MGGGGGRGGEAWREEGGMVALFSSLTSLGHSQHRQQHPTE